MNATRVLCTLNVYSLFWGNNSLLLRDTAEYAMDVSGHGLSGQDEVSIANGIFDIVAGKDGIHAENSEDPCRRNRNLIHKFITVTL